MKNELFNLRNISLCIFFIQCNVITKSDNANLSSSKINKDRQICSKFRFEGYFCTKRETCGYDGYTVEGAIDSAEVRSDITNLRNIFNSDFHSAEYACDSPSDICCRNSSYYGMPEPVVRELVEIQYACEDYASYGYHCVEDDQCGGDGYFIDDIISGGLEVRLGSIGSKALKLSCKCSNSISKDPSSRTFCCRNSTFYGTPEPPGIH